MPKAHQRETSAMAETEEGGGKEEGEEKGRSARGGKTSLQLGLVIR